MIKIIDFSGTSQGAYRLLRSRVSKINRDGGFENLIICPPGKLTAKIERNKIRVIEADIKRELNLFRLIGEIKQVYRIIKKESPDILHTHNSKAGAVGRLAAWFYKRNHKNLIVIHQVHGYHFTRFTGFKKRVYEFLEKVLSRITNYLLFQNEYELNLTKKMGCERWTRLKYIGNGIDFDEFDLSANAGKKENLIVCIARIEPVKNQKMLVEALGIMKNKFGFDEFRAVFIGEGDAGQFSELIRENDLKKNIEFTGQLDRREVVGYLQTAKLSILTSKKEGKPRSIMESMFFGIPCIGTDVVGTNELIINDFNGYLVQYGDYKSLADRIYKILTEDSVLKKFSRNAKEMAVNKFNEENVIEKLKTLYRESVNK